MMKYGGDVIKQPLMALLVWMMILFWLTPCFARSNTSEPPETEEEQSAGTGDSIKLETVTVVGTRMEVDIAKYPGSVGVVLGEDLENSFNVIESLSQIPGFETGGGHGRSIGQQFTIRGFGYQSEDRVIIKQDGIRRSTSMYSNHISSFRTDAEILKRVEVVKGASSIAHGGGAIGGVVGMTTKDAFDYLDSGDDFGSKVGLRYEENNHQSAYMAVYGNPNRGRFDYLVYGKLANTGDLKLAEPSEDNPETVENEEDLLSSFLKLGFQPTPDQRLTLSYFNYNEDVETTWQTVYHSEFPDDGPVEGELSQTDLSLGYTYQPADNDLIDLDVKLFYSAASYDRIADYTSSATYVEYENEDKSWGTNIKNHFDFNIGPFRQRLLAGFDFTRRQEDAHYVLNGETSDFGSMPNTYDDMGLYVQDEAPLMEERLVLYLGGRYDRFERSVDNKDADYDNSRFSPRVGAAFEAFSGFNLLANYSESFRAPTPHETSSSGPLNRHYWYMANPDLDSETAKEVEFGFSYSRDDLMDGRADFWLKAMYFDGEIEDMITFETLPELGETEEGHSYGTYMNVEKAKRHGFEVESRFRLGGLDLGGSFEHLDQYDSETHEKVPNGFADKLRTAVNYTHTPWGLSFGVDVNHWFDPDQNPETIVSGGETYYYVNESYTITNLTFRWRAGNTGFAFFDDGFELTGGVNNLFDKNYINARSVTTSSRSGKGRNIYVSVSKKF